ncbi:MAG: S8 family serine peptidase [Sedimentisphaerales bacterium]|nr:S8 family serine peptidase [Sedimentisphaerales bacterium]
MTTTCQAPTRPLVLIACLASSAALAANETRLDPHGVAAQAELIARLTVESQASKNEAIRWAQVHGYPIRYEDDRQVCELMGIWHDRPAYYVTENVNAAISTAADRIRNLEPWHLDGQGVILGLWDESIARASHQEFMDVDGKPRVRVGDGGTVSPHTTHVAGTLAAAGIDPAAMGMAPAARVQSFNWNYDSAKMASWAAYGPGQPNTIYISNHSYGYVGGWIHFGDDDVTGHVGWHWAGTWVGAKSYDDWFGAYHAIAQQWDNVAYVNTYYLAFAAAGNDRTDNPPLGETVYYFKNNFWYSIVYDLSTCPPGDGMAKGGYDTICGPGVAKNIMTVGAVSDAVKDGARSLVDANMASFSSWGPTNDGRIKPDIVSNGIDLYSADSDADDSYATHSGTSMASPSAAGSAALLVDLYQQLFPGKSMRSSSLKGLIIHTADDLGRPGPDYQFGWGLMNARAAAELIQRQYDELQGRSPELAGSMITEGRLSAIYPTDVNPDDEYCFWSDANEPIRVTLCWTDPPGTTIGDYDSPTPRLINDLDVRVIGPDRLTTCYPYILSLADPCAVATTGDDKLDNVEQVYIGTPAEAGLYKVRISYKGTLSRDQQYYSIVSSNPLYGQSPPIAEDTPAYTDVETATTITLKATDDGLPKAPGRLTYTLASLPQHGSLTYATGAPIAAPGRLADHARQVVYKPLAGYSGEDGFSFYADDGGTAPSGGPSNAARVSISITSLVTRAYQVLTREDDASVLSWSRIQTTADPQLRVGQYICGMRFQNIDIPPGAQITGACLRVYCRKAAGMKGLIQAEATSNAADLTGADRNILDMLRTQATVSWDWTGTEPADAWRSSPDCAAVVQEVVGRPDWKAGNAIVLLLSGTPTARDDLIFSARDSGTGVAPKLEITYTMTSSASADPGRNAPTATSVEMYVPANTPVPITLEANDDGLPGALQFTISSPPVHGSLALANGTPIDEPMSLVGSVRRITYTPNADFTGDDSFAFCADDGGSAPTGGRSNAAIITLKVRHMVTREYQVISQEDDAYGTDNATVAVSETLLVGQHSNAMRFRNIDLPQGSEIVGARLKVCMNTTHVSKPVMGVLYAQAVADAGAFDGPDLRIPALPRTQASVPWNWEAGRTWGREEYHPSPELRTVIQEIIDRDDWAAGNDMAIIYAGDPASGQDLKFFACSSPYSNRAARLEVTCVPRTTQEVIPPLLGQPPKARDSRVETLVGEPITITLEAPSLRGEVRRPPTSKQAKAVGRGRRQVVAAVMAAVQSG